MTSNAIRLHRDEVSKIITLTIHRPDKLNALSAEILRELSVLFEALAREPVGNIAGMLLTGSGERAFIAGADISAQSTMSCEEGAAFGRLGQLVTTRLEALPFPVIACVNGYALGGGCELAMACDYIFACSNAVFGQPEVNLGLIPGFGGCVRLLRRVGPARAKELIFTGRKIEAAEAMQIGLVQRICSSREQLLQAGREALAIIASNSPIAIAHCKQVLNSLEGRSVQEQLEIENAAFAAVFATEDMREGTQAFLSKRPAIFTGR